MALEFDIPGLTSGSTYYAVLIQRPSDGNIWYTVTPAFEAYNASHYGSYVVALTELGATGRFTGNFPTGIGSANVPYVWEIRLQAGGSPAISDVPVASGSTLWNGTKEVSQLDGVDLQTIKGTAQTGGDIYGTLNTRVPQNLLFDAGGYIKAGMYSILGTALTESVAGYIAAAFKKFFNVAAPTATADTMATLANQTTIINAVNAIPTNPLTSLGTNAPAGWINAAAIASNALNGKGDWLLATNYTTPPTAAQNATAVWTDLTTGTDFQTANSIGYAFANAPTVGSVWDVTRSTHTTSGTFGATTEWAGGAGGSNTIILTPFPVNIQGGSSNVATVIITPSFSGTGNAGTTYTITYTSAYTDGTPVTLSTVPSGGYGTTPFIVRQDTGASVTGSAFALRAGTLATYDATFTAPASGLAYAITAACTVYGTTSVIPFNISGAISAAGAGQCRVSFPAYNGQGYPNSSAQVTFTLTSAPSTYGGFDKTVTCQINPVTAQPIDPTDGKDGCVLLASATYSVTVDGGVTGTFTTPSSGTYTIPLTLLGGG